MKILILRHAVAEEREVFARSGKDDGERPLTPKGRAKMMQGADGLRHLLEAVDLIAHSPLRRARQTADILHGAYSAANRVELAALAPGAGPAVLGDWLQRQECDATVALIGHEPDLSHLIGWLTTGEECSFVRLKKGGAVLLEGAAVLGPAGAEIHWMLTPRQLRSFVEG